jgi:aerobic-type carbon monoxide dehydrogenase small subunit (CoxS/CutS family)
MATFFVNGVSRTTEETGKLIHYLRDTLQLTSVKDGCTEGACGTCMVLVDGKPAKACVLRTERMDGKQIVTVEGLSPREKDVYAYAFAEAARCSAVFARPHGYQRQGAAGQDAFPPPRRGERSHQE